MEIPKVGQTYNCFDDGKIRESRLYTVEVSEVIPFNEIDPPTLAQWKEECIECPWLYANVTDYFIKTENGENGMCGTFVRTINDGWFGIGPSWWNCGRLDVDNSLTNNLRTNN